MWRSNPISRIRDKEIFQHQWITPTMARFSTGYVADLGEIWYQVEFTNIAKHVKKRKLTEMPSETIIVHFHQGIGNQLMNIENTYEIPLKIMLAGAYTIIEIIYEYIIKNKIKIVIFPADKNRQEKRAKLFQLAMNILGKLLHWKHSFSQYGILVLAKQESACRQIFLEFYRASFGR